MAKHDWMALKAEFISGDYLTVGQFFAKKDISTNTYQKYTVGWGDEKKKIGERIIEKLIERTASARLRHARIGRKVQAVAGRSIGSIKFDGDDPQSIVNALKIGVEIEAKALGIGEKASGNQTVNVQVNTAVQPIETTALIALGKALAGAKAIDGERSDAPVGVGKSRKGRQP